ncbi:Copine-6 [Seminavis robusta]|uniref:Copine-6 n=1 Tax=Seminavis robusta TaxID=568900 RepID=A0A9N8HED5_9STRA|nr:Copine-6 [Seminavis robusta]|eukprot:Sro382_g131140.1 Copine-6 (606) ;mRNA; r:52296-54560
MKLELSIYARGLKNVAGFGKGTSDPFAIVTRLSVNENEKPEVIGKTEVVKNNLSPDFVKVFKLEYGLGTPQRIAINLFDEVRKKTNIGMGSAVFDVGELLGARGNTQIKKLKKGGQLAATVRKSEGSGILRLKMRGEKLKNTEGMFGKSDPFFELSRKVASTGGQTWDNVYRSAHIKNNLNPVWDEATVELSVLCGGNLDHPLSITVYDHEKSGKHVLMGHAETSVNGLLQAYKNGAARPMQLSKKGKTTGSLIITKAETEGIMDEPPTAQMAATSISPTAPVMSVPVTTATATGVAVGSAARSFASAPQSTSKQGLFVDYVSGGCELNVCVAIDFTGSNGDPRKAGTLHHMYPGERNSYQKAIAAIVSILLQYDSDKKIPVYGFGAKYNGVVRHCFQCGAFPEADGLKGIMDAYESTFSSGLIMSRPTVFNEVLKTAAAKTDKLFEDALKRGGQSYTILLIVTDGAVSDVNATAECLKEVSSSPMSVVIVGVGNADFRAMQFLDDFAQSSGTRDIAQFVAFNEHSHSSQSLTKATLEEIPEQMVGYFQAREIDPLPPIVRSEDSMSNIDSMEAEEEIDLSLDINEEEIVITGGGDNFINGFDAK